MDPRDADRRRSMSIICSCYYRNLARRLERNWNSRDYDTALTPSSEKNKERERERERREREIREREREKRESHKRTGARQRTTRPLILLLLPKRFYCHARKPLTSKTWSTNFFLFSEAKALFFSVVARSCGGKELCSSVLQNSNFEIVERDKIFFLTVNRFEGKDDKLRDFPPSFFLCVPGKKKK